MDQVIIHGEDQHGTKIELTLSAASILIGMRRSRLHSEARGVVEDIDRQLLRFLYCDVMAAATIMRRYVPDGEADRDGDDDPPMIWVDVAWPFAKFDEFLDWPDPIGTQLEKATYQLNPHWKLGAADPKDNSG